MEQKKTPQDQLNKILFEIDAKAKHPLVDPRFGYMWKENAIQNYSLETIVDIAAMQGRRAILLEGELLKLLAERSKA